jgi:hypothetical protein
MARRAQAIGLSRKRPFRMQERIERYQLIRHLGRGGMGDVYLARLEAAGQVQRLVAMKFLRDLEPQGAAGLLREARLTALLSHPNIVQVVDAGLEGERPWFAMEFVPGLSLAELLEAAGGRLAPWVASRIVADLALGVHALHEAKDDRGSRLEIVHRDISPDNVLVSWDGVVKLLDLGIARSQLQTTTTQTGTLRGKLAYMSPEQAGGGPVDRRSDVYCLGVLLWEALAGRRLFQGDTESELLARVIRGDVVPLASEAPDVAPSLAEVTERALSKRAADRFATSLEMHRALEIAMRASGVLVGAHEVASTLALLAPGRVREHEAWLRAADSASGGEAASKLGTLAVSVTRDAALGPPSPRRRRFQAMALFLVGLVGVAAFFRIAGAGLRRPPAPEPAAASLAPRAPPAVTTAPLQESATASESATPAGLPTPARAPGHPRPALPVLRPQVPSTPASFGTLNIVSSPSWSTVLLDGKVVGETPLMLRAVPSGAHSIEGRPLGVGAPDRLTITVQPDAVTRVELGTAH